MPETNNKRPPVDERRRDHRIDVDLPFLLTDPDPDSGGNSQWSCQTIDISPTGISVMVDQDQAPALGKIVTAIVMGPAEKGWEHINKRPMRVVRVDRHQTGLTYADLDSSKLAEDSS